MIVIIIINKCLMFVFVMQWFHFIVCSELKFWPSIRVFFAGLVILFPDKVAAAFRLVAAI